jgi:hypothetical protein
VLVALGAVTAVRFLRARLRVPAPAIVALVAVLILPMGLFDARVEGHPHTAALAGFDDRELVDDWPSGTGWSAVADVIRRQTGGRGAIIAVDGRIDGLTVSTRLEDLDYHRYFYADVSTPQAASAQYLIAYSQLPPVACGQPTSPTLSLPWGSAGCVPPSLPARRLLLTYSGPRDGYVLRLYRIGAGG